MLILVRGQINGELKYNVINIHLGYFEYINEAIINRRLPEEMLFKEFSPNEKIIVMNPYILEKSKKECF